MIRCVLGDIEPASLGAVNYHEHLFQVSQLLPGDELDDEAASQQEAELLLRSGFDSMVDATPIGLGRNPEALARVSAHTGLNIIATTGRHREAHYPPGHSTRDQSVASLTARFIEDIERAMPQDDGLSDPEPARSSTGTAVRAGMLKGGIGYWSISEFERATLHAIAAAHRSTNAPVMVHLEFCTAAHELLDLLEAEGVPAQRVVLAHADRDPDPELHTELAQRGAYLGYDGFARPRTRSDAELVTLTERVVAAGCGNRLLLGGDVARRSRYVAYGGMPGLAYLGERYLPRLRRAIGEDQVDRILRCNPAALLNM